MSKRYQIRMPAFRIPSLFPRAWSWPGPRLTAADPASPGLSSSVLVMNAAEQFKALTAIRVRDLGAIAVISMQLALTLLVLQQFQLESRTFFDVMLLGTAGFVIHAVLPLQYRLSFFTFLSLSAVVVAFGPLDGLSLIGLGLVLIGICHLPLRMAHRIGLLLAAGGLFALWRVELLPGPWSVAIWPILASMFMFRLALYLYALKHDEKRPTPGWTLAYFFMLPNVCFPLYPVIDYSTFTRTYYDREASQIYETGMRWIVRGVLHLILYRFVYLHLASDPAELLTLGDLVQFLLATFLLYLRVSGQFHLIIGILHLFGFRLPETHHLYYLASGFTDFWRRINIYWKDFMMKLVYYPSFFWLRRWGGNTALIGATVTVFVATWVLHSYQWFWLRGGFPLEPQDALFWGILGTLVVVASLREAKRPRKKTLGKPQQWSASLALRTVGTFTAICVLWSLWSAEHVGTWLMMWMVVPNVAPGDLWLLAALLFGGLLIAGRAWSVRETTSSTKLPLYRQPALQSTLLLVGILAVGTPELYARTAPQLASTAASLQRSTLNAYDAGLQHKGYYENLDNASRTSVQLWETQVQRPAQWSEQWSESTAAKRLRSDFLEYDLRPGAHSVFLGQPFTTNRWGMRGREYPLAKPERTYRIALLGPSFVMGWGVKDGETIADFLEQQLNAAMPDTSNTRYEVLNFGITNYSLLQQLFMLEERVVAFQPDAVFIMDSPPHAKRSFIGHLKSRLLSQVPIPYPELDTLIRRAGIPAVSSEPGLKVPFNSMRALLESARIKTRVPWSEVDRRLRLSADSLVGWTLGQITEVAHEHGAVPVFVGLNTVFELPRENYLLRDAKAAGFLVFDLLELWQHSDKAALRVAPWDDHPNADGNRLIAERLFELMQQHRSELRLTTAGSPSRTNPR